MAFELKNRWAVVTGASSGIGKAIAEELAAHGCHLFLVARREALLQELALRLSAKWRIEAKWLSLDLAQPEASQQLLERLADHPISIVVNNAGFAVAGAFGRADRETLSKMIDLNIRFLTDFCRLMIKPLQQNLDGARILNLGSVAGYQGVPHMAAYAASKAYVNHFTEGLSWELRGTGIGVTCLQPGQTATEFFEAADIADTHMANAGLMTAAAVAREGVAAMVKGKPRVVAGLLNKIRIFGLRLSPRSLVRVVITRMFRDMA